MKFYNYEGSDELCNLQNPAQNAIGGDGEVLVQKILRISRQWEKLIEGSVGPSGPHETMKLAPSKKPVPGGMEV